MKSRVTAVLAMLAVVGFVLASGLAQAAETHAAGTPIAAKGEIVDMWCYISHEAKGAGHKNCADACIKAGAPMGLLTSEGKLYVLLSDHGAHAKDYDSAKGLAAETVEVKGSQVERNGVSGIVVESVSKSQ